MTARVKIRPSGHEFVVEGEDTLLEAALRAGLALDYGCSSGSCGKCKARIVSGEVRRTRHSDLALTAAEKSAGIALMCCNTAIGDLVIEAREAHGAADMPPQRIEARVKTLRPLAEDIRLLHLQTPRTNRLRFLAGQSVSLALPDGSQAACPIASCPCDDRNLEFHVRRCRGDGFASRVFGALKSTDAVRVEGPYGEFVLDEASRRPLVFLAWGIAVAPVKSLIEHATALDAARPLDLYWIASAAGGHYLDNLCRAWRDALDEFRYVPLVADGAASDEHVAQAVLQQVLREHPDPAGRDVYVAGPRALAEAAGRALGEHGLPPEQLRVNTLAA
jgi:CDP-4-dehydro-6-deoxyglucose reductase, E3